MNEQEPIRAGELVGDVTAAIGGSRIFDAQYCIYCGCDLGAKQAIAICETCDQAAEQKQIDAKKAEEDARRERREQNWIELAGEYHDTEPGKLPTTAHQGAVRRWSPALRFGVTITKSSPHGRNARTRTIWALMRKAWESGRKFTCRPAAEYRQLAATLARHGEGARGIEDLVRVDVLAIDDFGLQHFTPASCELFGLLLEMRTKYGRPTIIAMPVSATAIGQAFKDAGCRATGEAFLRRISGKHAWLLDLEHEALMNPES